MTERKVPSKAQKKQFTKGFKYGRIEHRLESWTTIVLLLGFLLQIAAIWIRNWTYCVIATGFFGIALVFRVGAGIAHKIEKFYMDKLRFGKWKNKK